MSARQLKFLLIIGGFIAGSMGLCPGEGQAQTLNSLGPISNTAVSPPLGQGLDLVHGAEPLGKGRYRVRLLNRSANINLPGLGRGSSYTGGCGLALGISQALDLSLLVPFLMDSIGGFNKYGTGDPTLGVKFSRPGRLGNNYYNAFQILLGLPLGYKGEVQLDDSPSMRPYSSQSLDIGVNILLDMHFRHASLLLNGGYFSSGNEQNLSLLVYGIGVELGRRSRWGRLNLEYQTRVAFTERPQGVGILKFGTRINLFRGVELEVNREWGFLDYPYGSLFTFGLRLHGNRLTGRRLEARNTLYLPPPKPKRVYEPSEVVRVAFVDFAGFEEFKAGKRLVEKIKTQLEPHDSLEVVDLARYAGIPRRGFLKPRQALDLARKLGVDVVVTGTVAEYNMDRFAGPQLPFIVHLPETRVDLELRYRVIEFFDEDKSEMRALSETVAGGGLRRMLPRILPTSRHDITSTASAAELQAVHEEALDNLVKNLLASMSSQFTWIPPDFQP